MLVSNVILHIELLFAKFAAVGALEARRFAAVVLEVSRHGALRGVGFPAARARVAGPRFPRALARVGLLEPRQRQHLQKRWKRHGNARLARVPQLGASSKGWNLRVSFLSLSISLPLFLPCSRDRCERYLREKQQRVICEGLREVEGNREWLRLQSV